ncbi:hypothetical protein JCM6882_006809 [Rhodosporidiobolus microsporus]
MLRTLYVLALSGLLASTATAAPTTCTGAKFLDAATGTCQPCVGRTVKTCSSATFATSCVSRYYLTANGQCVANGSCPAATFANQSTGKCDKCYSPNYKTCSGAAATAATSCMNNTCLPSTGGRCLPFNSIKNTSYCTPDGTVAPCQGTGVKTCSVDGAPLSCFDGYFFSEKACLSSCPEGQKGFEGACVDESYCPAGIYEPFTKQCIEAWYASATIVDGVSVPAEYRSEDNKTCLQCKEPNALECDQATGLAVSCIEGYKLGEGQCYEDCPLQKGQTTCGETTNISGCPGTQYLNVNTGRCVNVCPDTAVYEGSYQPATYPDASTMTCLACKGGQAYTCDQTLGWATKCYNSYLWTHDVLDNGLVTDQAGKCINSLQCANMPGYPWGARTSEAFDLPLGFGWSGKCTPP